MEKIYQVEYNAVYWVKASSEEQAIELWKTMEFFSGYGFNLSHAVCYSILSYQCAYLFYHLPAEWLAAFLDKEPEDRKEKAVNIAKGLGFKIKQLLIVSALTFGQIGLHIRKSESVFCSNI